MSEAIDWYLIPIGIPSRGFLTDNEKTWYLQDIVTTLTVANCRLNGIHFQEDGFAIVDATTPKHIAEASLSEAKEFFRSLLIEAMDRGELEFEQGSSTFINPSNNRKLVSKEQFFNWLDSNELVFHPLARYRAIEHKFAGLVLNAAIALLMKDYGLNLEEACKSQFFRTTFREIGSHLSENSIEELELAYGASPLTGLGLSVIEDYELNIRDEFESYFHERKYSLDSAILTGAQRREIIEKRALVWAWYHSWKNKDFINITQMTKDFRNSDYGCHRSRNESTISAYLRKANVHNRKPGRRQKQ